MNTFESIALGIVIGTGIGIFLEYKYGAKFASTVTSLDATAKADIAALKTDVAALKAKV